MDTTPSTKRPREEQVSSPVLRTDGIALKGNHLKRTNVVNRIISTARERQHVVVGSSPATGKTSLLQLVEQIVERDEATVIRFSPRHRGLGTLFSILAEEGFPASGTSKLKQLRNTWLMLDDAQSAYGEEYFPFWEYVVKDVQAADVSNNVFVVIGATYDLATHDSPVQFKDLAHVHENISREEANELFLMFAKVWGYESWETYADTLLKVSKLSDGMHHVGTVMAGVRMLEEARKSPGALELVEATVDRSTSLIVWTDASNCLLVLGGRRSIG